MIGPLVQCKECWLRLVSQRVLIITHSRALCTSKPGMSEEEMDEVAKRREAYRQLEKLDFMTATKIMLTVPPKRKKFGCIFSGSIFSVRNEENGGGVGEKKKS
ncbi:unnamed protein product [Rhodiola kirilowii]